MIKNHIIAYVIAVAVITIPVIPAVHAAPGTGDTESSSVTGAPGTGGSTSSSAPGTGESTSSSGSTAPGTGESTSSSGSTAPSTGDSTSSAGPADGSSTPTTPTDEPRRSSGGGRRSSNGTVAVTTTPVVTTVVGLGTCPLITSYMRIGVINNVAEVTKLQSFLKNVEKLNVDVNGTFDQKTDTAVKAFQLKYLPTVLGPWSATRATGNVYITTTKKINELACATPFVLSASDRAIIEAYKAGSTTVDGQPTEIGQTDETGTSTDVGTTDGTDEGTETDESTDVAAAGGASILSRFWNFIKSLFR